MDTVKRPAEQKVILSDVSWGTYERLLADHESSSAPRFTFDRGVLEIMSPSSEHEAFNRSLALLVEFVAEELDVDAYDLGSTTFRRGDLEHGFEPDSYFYIQSEAQVRGKDHVDLAVYPPPDLVIEVDIISPSTDKLPICAGLGVSEVWRYDGEKLENLRLEDEGYVETSESAALSGLKNTVFTGLVERSKSVRRTVWLQEVREAARQISS